MEIPVLAKTMELDNLVCIWLFCVLLEYHVS